MTDNTAKPVAWRWRIRGAECPWSYGENKHPRTDADMEQEPLYVVPQTGCADLIRRWRKRRIGANPGFADGNTACADELENLLEDAK